MRRRFIYKFLQLFITAFLCTNIARAQSSVRFPLMAQDTLPLSYAYTRLENGLSVLFISQNETPLTSVALAVRGGSLTNDAGFEGAGYGLTRLYTAQYETDAARLGADFEAAFEAEHFFFQYTATVDKWRETLDLLSRFMSPPTIDAVLVKLFRVGAAKRAAASIPLASFRQDMEAAQWGAYRKRKQSVPQYADLHGLTPEKLEAYYARYFAPQNALLIISGPISQEEALRRAAIFFEGWRGAEAPPELAWRLSAHDTAFWTLHEGALTPVVTLGWRTPPANPTHAAVVAVLDRLAATPETRLDRRLKATGLAYAMPVRYEPSRLYSALYWTFLPQKNKLIELLTRLPDELNALGQNGAIIRREVEDAKAALETRRTLDEDASSRLPEKLARVWATGNLTDYFMYPSIVQKLTQNDVQQFIVQYCLKNPLAAGVLTNGEDEPLDSLKFVLRRGARPDSLFIPKNIRNLPLPQALARARVYFPEPVPLLDDSARARLRELADRLFDEPNLVLYIDGYAAPTDSAELSLDIATEIKNYMVKALGIAPDRLPVRGYRAATGTERQTRRAEFKLKSAGASK